MLSASATLARPWARALLVSTMLLAASAGEAMAQVEQAPPRPASDPGSAGGPPPVPVVAQKRVREGFLLGLDFGFGSLNYGSQSDSTVNYLVELGGFISPNWALSVGFWGGSSNEEFSSVSNSNAGVMAQYYFSKAFWAKGRLGSANITFASDAASESIKFEGIATGGMVGWDFYNHAAYHAHVSFGLSLQGYENSRDNVTATAITIGLQYF